MIYKVFFAPLLIIPGLFSGTVALAGDTPEEEDSKQITVLDQVVPVADDLDEGQRAIDDGTDVAGSVGPPTEADEEKNLTDRELLELEFSRFARLKENGMLDEAENSAKRAIEMSIRSSGPTSNETGKALSNLATVQYDRGEYELAQQNFQSAIDIFIDNQDQLSVRLLNPLKGLGAAQLEGGRPDLAAETFTRAAHISHVNEGPHNLEQIPILEALAETNLRMRNLDAAKDAQDMIYAINMRHLDGDPMAMVPPLMRRAAWQRRTGYVLDERATYRRIIRIIEDAKGKDDLSLIAPLSKLAESYFYIDTSESTSFQTSTIATGEVYFKRAVRIAEDSPDSSWQILASTQIALADYYNYRADQGRARRSYRDAWDLLSTDDERLEVRHEALERLLPLNGEPISPFVGDATREDVTSGDSDLRKGSIVVAYDVSSRGRVTKVEVIEAIPPEFEDMQKEVEREVRHRIFRPPFIDGEPVESQNQVLTHTYYYQQSELDKLHAAAATAD
ncbi:MAG TPA: tetratricopeptide repeat protein [Woeseiaceae bacterium]|nr:tetratricopeptide repeat protein [Woeseiaceae bacterium]